MVMGHKQKEMTESWRGKVVVRKGLRKHSHTKIDCAK